MGVRSTIWTNWNLSRQDPPGLGRPGSELTRIPWLLRTWTIQDKSELDCPGLISAWARVKGDIYVHLWTEAHNCLSDEVTISVLTIATMDHVPLPPVHISAIYVVSVQCTTSSIHPWIPLCRLNPPPPPATPPIPLRHHNTTKWNNWSKEILLKWLNWYLSIHLTKPRRFDWPWKPPKGLTEYEANSFLLNRSQWVPKNCEFTLIFIFASNS